jgi:putative ABC transport system ATP-binding protein
MIMGTATKSELGIHCRELTKDYGTGEARVRALRGINLDISPGELTLLVGPSGCGKTTLISVIAGTLDATSGEISVFGTKLDRLSKGEKTAFRAQNFGFVFQQFNLLPALTATENVAVPLVISGRPWPEALEQAAAVLRSVGLVTDLNRCHVRCRAASSSAWRSPGAWSTPRACLSVTSRRQISTPGRARQSWN